MPIGNGDKVGKENRCNAPVEAELFVLDVQIEELNELFMDFFIDPTPENASIFLNRYNEVFMPVEYDEGAGTE